jgi:hypothetical protein
VVQHLQTWQDLAYATPGRHRQVGSKGHNDSLADIVKKLEALGGYYSIEKQPFNTSLQVLAEANLTVSGTPIAALPMSYTKNGTLTGLPLIFVNSYGCNSVSHVNKKKKEKEKEKEKEILEYINLDKKEVLFN